MIHPRPFQETLTGEGEVDETLQSATKANPVRAFSIHNVFSPYVFMYLHVSPEQDKSNRLVQIR